MLLVRVHPNPRPLKFILVGRLTAFRFYSLQLPSGSSRLTTFRVSPLGRVLFLFPIYVVVNRVWSCYLATASHIADRRITYLLPVEARV